ncbi:MAG: nucleoside hydrolase [Clostridia bacterium]|nr:nucleoside hydrolase [Clostridia bacterium]
MKKIPVIIDCDPGVDDLLALKIAFGSPLLDIRLVTSVAGNVSIENTTNNAVYLTKTFGGDIPVAKGFTAPGGFKDASNVHGATGLGGFSVPELGYSSEQTDAVTAIFDELSASDEKVTLLTLGPLTNIAMLIREYPGICAKIERIYAMIASIDGTGNVDDNAEFNAHCDPEALDTVIKSGMEIVFAPMHLGREAKLPCSAILDRGTGELREMLECIFGGYKDSAAGDGFVAMYDANAVEALIRPELYRFVRCRPTVNTTDSPGRTFLIPDGEGKCEYVEIRELSMLQSAMLDDIFAD